MGKEMPRWWAHNRESWPFGGLRPGAPPGVQITTAVVRHLLENADTYRQLFGGSLLGRDGEVPVREVVKGEVELDFAMMVDLEQYLEANLWPTRAELRSATEPA